MPLEVERHRAGSRVALFEELLCVRLGGDIDDRIRRDSEHWVVFSHVEKGDGWRGWWGFLSELMIVGEARALTPIANPEVSSRSSFDFRSKVSCTQEANLPMSSRTDILGGS